MYLDVLTQRLSTSDSIMSDDMMVTDELEAAKSEQLDLVGGPFAVIESDPGVFTTFVRKLGIGGLEVVELYDIEPWAVEHLKPHGLIFCFLWADDIHHAKDFEDPAAEHVWFANQLSHDSCASFAILNVLLNCPGCDIGGELREFREETKLMSSVMKGLAISNSPFIRDAHNSLARPSDIRGALHALATTSLKASKKSNKPPPAKRRKAAAAGSRARKSKAASTTDDSNEAYHFIGYVPAHGKVWELDGLKSGPLEVGELPDDDPLSGQSWMDVVRPALRMKMEKYGASADGEGDIRFSLLALVDDQYQKASDQFELLKREKVSIERRLDEALPEGWKHRVDPLLVISDGICATTVQSEEPGPTYSSSFGHEKMQKQRAILDLPPENLLTAWQECMHNVMQAKITVEDEISKAATENSDMIKRTHDFEPFIREYISHLHQEGLLNPLLGRNDNGRSISTPATKGKMH
ncbi:hypothetical protein EVG20_g9089 [Dentipellis fragilis]|uniref:ubiquitinyl hydrolase 1 n=1 Tax=Dentipellis fragilis TaxID=205917 RepID=A0A4Y9Y1T3_9AGAM|nr:hypothetical protein EVG20_g9089 [Dentipellis fragilis]